MKSIKNQNKNYDFNIIKKPLVSYSTVVYNEAGA